MTALKKKKKQQEGIKITVKLYKSQPRKWLERKNVPGKKKSYEGGECVHPS